MKYVRFWDQICTKIYELNKTVESSDHNLIQHGNFFSVYKTLFNFKMFSILGPNLQIKMNIAFFKMLNSFYVSNFI